MKKNTKKQTLKYNNLIKTKNKKTYLILNIKKLVSIYNNFIEQQFFF